MWFRSPILRIIAVTSRRTADLFILLKLPLITYCSNRELIVLMLIAYFSVFSEPSPVDGRITDLMTPKPLTYYWVPGLPMHKFFNFGTNGNLVGAQYRSKCDNSQNSADVKRYFCQIICDVSRRDRYGNLDYRIVEYLRTIPATCVP